MKLFKYIFISILFTSCKYGTHFEVQNNTKSNIDSLIITNGFNSLKFYNIAPNDKEKGILDFSKNNGSNNDGNYKINISSMNYYRYQFFGYYSNGTPSESKFKIMIENDTILINEYFD